ncbi:MAG: response regulator [Bacteroidetes bacterium]|nr:response regulator [Bacteroidota bacterium]
MAKSIKILYAEDNQMDIDLTRQFFNEIKSEFELTIANDGKQALKLLEKNDYHIVLLDFKLPDIDGIKIIKTIRSHPDSVPIILLTGSGDENLIMQSLKSGANDYVTKKEGYIKKLPGIIRRVISDSNKMIKPFDHTISKILYIEDETRDIDLLTEYFTENARHLEITATDNEQKALKLLKKTDAFDLVLCDLKLLNNSAIEIMQEVKKYENDIPFIIITGKGDEESALEALKEGAYDYLVKSENYLSKLPYAIENTIARFRNNKKIKELNLELSKANKSMEKNMKKSKMELQEITNKFLEIENKIKSETKELEEISNRRENFFRLFAHDIKNPFHGLLGYIELLLMDYKLIDDQQRLSHVREIQKFAQEVYNLLENLMEWAKIQGGFIHVKKKEVSVFQVYDMVLNLFIVPSKLKNLTLDFKVSQDFRIKTDQNMLFTVLRNLISNAVKFSNPGGRIEIDARLKEGFVQFCVKDYGCGISLENQDKLFKIDRYFSTEGSKGEKGTGFGLLLVKELVEMNEGQINFESQEGKGSTFHVFLPNE